MAEDRSIRVTIGDEQPINITLEGSGCAGFGGDMYKSVYDTNDNGIVDAAESVNDGAGKSKTATEIYDHIEDPDLHRVHTYVPEYRAYEIDEP